MRLLVSPLEVHFRPDVVWFRAKTANELIEWELSTYSSRYCTKPVLLLCFPNSSFVNHDVGEHLSLSLSLSVGVVFVVVVFVMKAVLLPRWCVFQRFSQTGTERSCSLVVATPSIRLCCRNLRSWVLCLEGKRQSRMSPPHFSILQNPTRMPPLTPRIRLPICPATM